MNRIYISAICECDMPDFGNAHRAHMAQKTCAEAYRASRAAWRMLADAVRNAGIERLPTAAFGARGKPYFTDCALHFSLSHSGNMAAVILSSAPCGIDIEKTRSDPNGRLYARCAAQSEIRAGMDFPDVWTVKESLGKLTGNGIGARPCEIDSLGAEYAGYTRIFRTLRDADGNVYRLCAVSEDGAEFELHIKF